MMKLRCCLVFYIIWWLSNIGVVYDIQTAYYFKHEFVTVSNVSEAVGVLKASRTFKLNRTTTAVNFTFTTFQDFGDEVKVRAEGFRFIDNEYKKGPIDFSVSLCEGLTKEIFDIHTIILTKSNVPPRCPVKKGNYAFYDLAPDAKYYPQFIPSGRWMVRITFILPTGVAAVVDWRLEVIYYTV